MVKNPK